MRSRLSKENMDLVMEISRKYNLKMTNVLDFILDNPDVILITRCEIKDEARTGKGCPPKPPIPPKYRVIKNGRP